MNGVNIDKRVTHRSSTTVLYENYDETGNLGERV